ncbi:hypothetical protein BTJ45_04813 [Bacillus mycoides]|nr:hypothetical protein BTJ45_04813 [Bacillus mycoides]
MILVLASAFTTSAFADRTLIIPNLPKQPYRYGVVAHSTATSEISKSMSLVHGETHLFNMLLIGMKQSKSLI